jgi:hypothetical protein
MKRVKKEENTEDQSHFSAHSPLLSLVVSVPSQFLFSFLSILSNLVKLSLTHNYAHVAIHE